MESSCLSFFGFDVVRNTRSEKGIRKLFPRLPTSTQDHLRTQAAEQDRIREAKRGEWISRLKNSCVIRLILPSSRRWGLQARKIAALARCREASRYQLTEPSHVGR